MTSTEYDSLPVLRARLTETGTLRAKFPVPKARWHGKYASIHDVVKAAREANAPEPMAIHYVTEED